MTKEHIYLDQMTLKGFKSIKTLERLPLRALNLLIGANGAGKSNFLKALTLLNTIVDKKLQLWIGREGGADDILYFGQKITTELQIELQFKSQSSEQIHYQCTLIPAQNDTLIFAQESGSNGTDKPQTFLIDGGYRESNLHQLAQNDSVAQIVLNHLKNWRVYLYHFHDTTTTAKMRQQGDLHDNLFFRSDASNLAAFLYLLKKRYPLNYQNIVEAVRLVAPFFEDFRLQPSRLNPEKIQLEWQHVGSDRYFNAHTFSDGTLRFIGLATLLLQPELPTTILLDEPELGLHPYAITILAEMMQSAATKTQIIASTQSVTLVNQFQLEDIIVIERENEQSRFKSLNSENLTHWLDNYSLGELWEKNVLGGRP
jgi:predicted ATPase